MQQMMIDASGEPFAKLMQDTVLGPIGMTHSTYEQPLPEKWVSMAATPYDANDKAIAGGAHTYPERAAAGLWTTPTDLAKYEIEVERSLEGQANHVLSKEMTEQMLTPGMGEWGLGVQIGGSKTNPYFTHGGMNEGFESDFAAYEKGGEGAVVMTNAQGGEELAQEVMRSIAVEYGWPDMRPEVKTIVSVPVDAKVLAGYAGTYEIRPGLEIVVKLKGDHLVGAPTGQREERMIPESQTRFFVENVNAELEFVPDVEGKVTYVLLDPTGRKMKVMKK
jgi:CubicO group peptidase (beta-lactamase class C family)